MHRSVKRYRWKRRAKVVDVRGVEGTEFGVLGHPAGAVGAVGGIPLLDGIQERHADTEGVEDVEGGDGS